MTDLMPPPVPPLSDQWVAARSHALLTQLESRRRRTKVLARVGTGGGIVAAGATAATVLLGATAPAAFAGWSATPSTVSTAQTKTAQARCAAMWKRGGRLPGSAADPAAADHLALADQRGPYSLLLYASRTSGASGTSGAFCVVGPGVSSASESSYSSEPATGRVAMVVSAMESRAGRGFSTAVGPVGAGVKAVTLALADGKQVEASVTDGWYGAWWPGSSRVESVKITTAAGTTTVPASKVSVTGPRAGFGSSQSLSTQHSGSASSGGSGGGGGFPTLPGGSGSGHASSRGSST